jgi:hypothetical protein
VIRPDIPGEKQIISFITECDFLCIREYHQIATRNRQHRLYSFYLPAIGRDVVMKIHWVDPTYPLFRRIEICISSIFKNRCKFSFYGALTLQNAGVRTLNPLAYWSYGTSRFLSEQYFLYEKIHADFSMLEYRNHIKKKPTPAHRQTLDGMIEGMADLAATIHRHNLRHGDLAFGNILVDLNQAPGELNEIPRTASPSLYIIDTDQVRFNRCWNIFLKKILDLRSLKPIHLDNREQRIFFKKYFNKNDVDFWIRVFRFWQRGKHRVFRRIRHWWCQREKG